MNGKRCLPLLAAAALSIALALASCENPSSSTSARSVPALSRAVYIVNSLAETVSVFDPAARILYGDVITTGKWPNAVVPYDGKLYVVNSGDNNVQVLRESDYAPVATISLGTGRNPWTLIVDTVRNKGYVPNFLKGSVSVIDLSSNTVTKEIDLDTSTTVSTGPEGGCYLNGRVYIGNTSYSSGSGTFGEGKVSVIDTATDTLTATVSVEASGWTSATSGANPQSLIPVASLSQVHVVCTGVNGSDDGQIVVLDVSGATPVVSGRLAIGGSPLGSADCVDSSAGRAYLSGVGGVMTYIESPLAVEKGSSSYLYAADSGVLLSGLAYDSVNGILIAADYNNDRLLIIDPATGSILKSILASDGPQTPALFVN